MRKDSFQPISVKPPSANPLLFRIRCLVDLQLATIVRPLRTAMAALPAGEILDVGAGESPWKEWLPAHCRYQGIDIANAAEFAMSARHDDVVLYDGGTMPLADGRFDGALCIEVLEHAQDPGRLLDEIARVLKPGAPLLLTVPWSARRHHIPHDYHRFTRERLATLLPEHGFADVAIAERGNDIAVISNKLLVATIRLAKSTTLLNAIVQVPLAIVFAALSAFMLAMAHLSMRLGRGSAEDPLGYFCRAVRA